MKHILNLTLTVMAAAFLGSEASAQDRRFYTDYRTYPDTRYRTDIRYDRGVAPDSQRESIQDQVRELNGRLARVRAELRSYGASRQARRQFAHVESQVDSLNAQFRSGRYDRGFVRQELAQLENDLRSLSADLRQSGRSNYAGRDNRSDYLEYHPTNVQRALASQGYYRGPIDGDIGPGTSKAIVRFQTDRGLRVTGRVDQELLRLLGIQ
jgi:Putative peptidoglycan binding domain